MSERRQLLIVRALNINNENRAHTCIGDGPLARAAFPAAWETPWSPSGNSQRAKPTTTSTRREAGSVAPPASGVGWRTTTPGDRRRPAAGGGEAARRSG